MQVGGDESEEAEDKQSRRRWMIGSYQKLWMLCRVKVQVLVEMQVGGDESQEAEDTQSRRRWMIGSYQKQLQKGEN